jgi:F-type H+-transporting ATPase subunit b
VRDFSRLAGRRSSVLPFVLLGALALAVCAAPGRALAQESAPAAATSATDQGAQTAVSDEKKELDSFTHAPMVARIGHLFGLSVDTTANIFLLLNFAIIFLAIVIPLAKIMPRVLRGRKEALSQNLRTAREATEDANTRLSAVEAKLKGLDEEIAKFRAQVEQDSLEDEKRIKASLAEESARIVSAAEQEIAAAAAQARRGLRTFAADLAIAHAEKQMVLTAETDRALIGEFISEVSASGRGKGGTN